MTTNVLRITLRLDARTGHCLRGGIVPKARESWPATARVYFHRFEKAWPAEAEIVDQAPVLLCRRRGAAIDLVLGRPRLARFQFVFTR